MRTCVCVHVHALSLATLHREREHTDPRAKVTCLEARELWLQDR